MPTLFSFDPADPLGLGVMKPARKPPVIGSREAKLRQEKADIEPYIRQLESKGQDTSKLRIRLAEITNALAESQGEKAPFGGKPSEEKRTVQSVKSYLSNKPKPQKPPEILPRGISLTPEGDLVDARTGEWRGNLSPEKDAAMRRQLQIGNPNYDLGTDPEIINPQGTAAQVPTGSFEASTIVRERSDMNRTLGRVRQGAGKIVGGLAQTVAPAGAEGVNVAGQQVGGLGYDIVESATGARFARNLVDAAKTGDERRLIGETLLDLALTAPGLATLGTVGRKIGRVLIMEGAENAIPLAIRELNLARPQAEALVKQLDESVEGVAQRFPLAKLERQPVDIDLRDPIGLGVKPKGKNLLPQQISDQSLLRQEKPELGIQAAGKKTQGPKIAPPEIVQEAQKIEPQIQKATHAEINAERKAEGIPVVTHPKEPKSWKSTLEEGRANYKFEDYHDSLRQMLKAQEDGKPVPAFNESQQASMLDHLQNAKQNRSQIRNELNLAREAGQDTSKLQSDLEQWDTIVQEVRSASDLAGTTTGRALNIRRMAVDTSDYTAPELKAEWESQAGRKLTTEESAEAQRVGGEIERLSARIAELEKRGDPAAAEEFVKRQGRRKPISREAIQARRSEAGERLRQKWSESGKGRTIMADPLGVMTASETAQRLAEIAPEVLEIAKTYVDEGVLVAREVAKKTAEHLGKLEIKGVSEEDVHAILGRQVKSESPEKILSDWNRVRKEAEGVFIDARKELADQRKALESKEREIQTNFNKEEKSKALKALAAEKAQLLKEEQEAKEAYRFYKDDVRRREVDFRKGERTEASAERQAYVEWWKKSVGGQRAQLLNQIDDEATRLAALERGALTSKPKTQYDKALDDLVFKREALKIEADKKAVALRIKKAKTENGKLSNVMDALVDVAGLPRSLKASLDISAPLTQGFFALTSNTREWGQAFSNIVKYAKTKEYGKLLGELRADPAYSRIRVSGVELPGLGGHPGEEFFISSIPGKVPGYRALYNLSQREYDGFLSVLRFNMAKEMIEVAEMGGTKLDKEGLRIIGSAVNSWTGAGMNEVARSISASKANPLFAARYWSSLFETANLRPLRQAVVYGSRTGNWAPAKLIAKKYARSAMVTITGAAMAGELLKGKGYEVERDTRHVNFGRAVKTNSDGSKTTVDLIPPQYQQPIRLLGQLFGGRIGNDGKHIEGFYGRSLTIGGLLEGKLAPLPKVGFGIIDKEQFGKSYDPETLEGWTNILADLTIPISPQQAYEIWKAPGLSDWEKAIFIGLSPTGKAPNIIDPPKDKKSSADLKDPLGLGIPKMPKMRMPSMPKL